MKRRVIFIILPIILVLVLLASPVLAKAPGLPRKGLLWEAISMLAQQLNEGLESLQGQIDSIQAYLANFTEEDPVFSAMDTETELEAQIGGENILTQGEHISLLSNNRGYIAEGDVVCEHYPEDVKISASVPGVYYSATSFIYEDTFFTGETVLSIGGHVYYMWEGNPKELSTEYYTLSTNIHYDSGSIDVQYIAFIKNPFAFEKTFTIDLYCVYID